MIVRDKMVDLANILQGDGKYFEPLLEFLRTGQLVIPNTMDPRCVLRESEFYGIALPINVSENLVVDREDSVLLKKGAYFSKDMALTYSFLPNGTISIDYDDNDKEEEFSACLIPLWLSFHTLEMRILYILSLTIHQ